MRRNKDSIKNFGEELLFKEHTEEQKSVKVSQKRLPQW